jgi:hypothetical protein
MPIRAVVRFLRFRSQLLPHRQVVRGVPACCGRGWLAAHAGVWIEIPYGV